MCGICAAISENTTPKAKQQLKTAFTPLLIANQERGEDSTGVMAINTSTGEHRTVKDTKTAKEFVHTPGYNRITGNIYIGHTRQATHGSVNARNAHPLKYKNIRAVHNGIITNYERLAKKNGTTAIVDTEAILPYFQKEDWNGLQKAQGSLAVIAYNTRRKRLYIVRHESPLFYTYLPEHRMHLFSSIKDIADTIANTIEPTTTKELREDELTIIDIAKDWTTHTQPLHFPEYRDRIGYTYGHQYAGWSSYEPHYFQCAWCRKQISEDQAIITSEATGYALCQECASDHANYEDKV